MDLLDLRQSHNELPPRLERRSCLQRSGRVLGAPGRSLSGAAPGSSASQGQPAPPSGPVRRPGRPPQSPPPGPSTWDRSGARRPSVLAPDSAPRPYLHAGPGPSPCPPRGPLCFQTFPRVSLPLGRFLLAGSGPDFPPALAAALLIGTLPAPASCSCSCPASPAAGHWAAPGGFLPLSHPPPFPCLPSSLPRIWLSSSPAFLPCLWCSSPPWALRRPSALRMTLPLLGLALPPPGCAPPSVPSFLHNCCNIAAATQLLQHSCCNIAAAT
ncbi:proline-rich protein 36-like [Hypomesus transpacificus]|uniref:proline-rich protein 36-like n=1 Tax=Hypomesus transpacificus TaxID=137520 RepID=UPI001F07D6F3|nr:proline-rich protein 36-like [Hypomesus transpacificus]